MVSTGALLAALGVAILANVQMRLPYERRVRGVPWLGLQFIAVVIVLIMMTHIVTLLVGHDFHGARRSY
ncbi:MAG: hypothetical protein IPK59_01810 [Rhodospirillaceae bacterium]|nr:hypothetical protein [Rhodospirillaceae bacterium]